MAKVELIIIPTCRRVRQATACISDLVRNLNLYGRKTRILISEGSGDQAVEGQLRELVENIGEHGGVDITVVGSSIRGKLGDYLSGAGFDSENVRFCTEGILEPGLVRTGANRNALALMTEGKSIVSIDDDLRIRFGHGCATPFVEEQRRELDPRSDPVQHWVFADRQSLLDVVPLVDRDLIGMHEAVLGEAIFPSVRDVIRISHKPMIRMSVNGLLGDCGWGSPSKYFDLDRVSLQRITRDDCVYEMAVSSREQLRMAPAFAVRTEIDDFMATCYGLADASTFPPFIPVGRGSDALMGHVLKRVDAATIIAHLPWPIYHTAEGRRSFHPNEILRSATSMDLCSVVGGLVEFAGGCNVRSMKDLGRHLEELGALATNDFRDALMMVRLEWTKRKIEVLEGKVTACENWAPKFRDHLSAHLEALIVGDALPEAGIPIELLFGHSQEHAVVLTKTIIKSYGQLLNNWEDMLDVAREWSLDCMVYA